MLRALDYFRGSGADPDPRMAEAVEVVRSKRQPDGRWLLDRIHPGRVHFDLEDGVGDAEPVEHPPRAPGARLVGRDRLISAVGRVSAIPFRLCAGIVGQLEQLFDAGQLQFDIPKKGFHLVKLRQDARWRWIRGVLWRNVTSQPFACFRLRRSAGTNSLSQPSKR